MKRLAAQRDLGGAYNLGLTSVSGEEDVDVLNRVIHIFAGISFPIGSSAGM